MSKIAIIGIISVCLILCLCLSSALGYVFSLKPEDDDDDETKDDETKDDEDDETKDDEDDDVEVSFDPDKVYTICADEVDLCMHGHNGVGEKHRMKYYYNREIDKNLDHGTFKIEAIDDMNGIFTICAGGSIDLCVQGSGGVVENNEIMYQDTRAVNTGINNGRYKIERVSGLDDVYTICADGDKDVCVHGFGGVAEDNYFRYRGPKVYNEVAPNGRFKILEV